MAHMHWAGGSQAMSHRRSSSKEMGRWAVKSERKPWWLLFSGGREFEARQWREGEGTSILMDLCCQGKVGCLFESRVTQMEGDASICNNVTVFCKGKTL